MWKPKGFRYTITMRVLITGAKGQLGKDLIKAFSAEEIIAHDVDTLDITDFEAVQNEFLKQKPDVVINSAAFTNVDGCESNPEGAYAVNAVGTANLAMATNAVDGSMLCVSTDYVFDGSATKPYLEWDPANPASVYGASKRAGEEALMSLTNKFYIARTAWLYGHGGNNFVKTIQKVAKEKGELKVVDDQRGSPTFTWDLARKIYEIVKSNQYGIYHVTNSGDTTWYEFTKEILRLSNIEAKVDPCATDEFPRPAKRPAYSVMENFNLKLRGFKPMRPWQEALKDYFV